MFFPFVIVTSNRLPSLELQCCCFLTFKTKTVTEGWAIGHFPNCAPLLVKSPPIHVDNDPNIQHRFFCPLVIAPKFGRTMSQGTAVSPNLTPCDPFHLFGECLWMGLTSNVCMHVWFHFWLLSNYRYLKMCKRAQRLPCSPPPRHVWSSPMSP